MFTQRLNLYTGPDAPRTERMSTYTTPQLVPEPGFWSSCGTHGTDNDIALVRSVASWERGQVAHRDQVGLLHNEVHVALECYAGMLVG